MEMIFVENEKLMTREIANQKERGETSAREPVQWWMSAVFILCDVLSLLAAGVISVLVRYLFEETVWIPYFAYQVGGLVVLILIFYALNRLYPGIGIGPVEEMRRIAVTTSLVVFLLTSLTFWTKTGDSYSRLTFGGIWLLGMLFVPLGRKLARKILQKFNLWGEPVVIFGQRKEALYLAKYLTRHQYLGFYPALIMEQYSNFSDLNRLALTRGGKSIQTAIVINSEKNKEFTRRMIKNKGDRYNRLILVSSLNRVESVGVSPLNLGGVVGFEVQGNLMNQLAQSLKRMMDIGVVLIGSVFALPLLVVLSVMVKLDSKGPIFYGHTRVGKNGKEFTMWKFRSMASNADQVLEQYLRDNPSLREEWESDQKLKNDPRITRMGALLRKYSLDELPQLWNVLLGDMSLVGPRPIVNEEAARYAESFQFYKKVKPGITGLWQVSGRNNTTYKERVRLDEYYVRNWSIWLDIYILLRTFRVVCQGEGAY
jgi:Undecaprenyl-phosphate galactose phosphotransferase WbaP